jgi:hypothetical protein
VVLEDVLRVVAAGKDVREIVSRSLRLCPFTARELGALKRERAISSISEISL